MNTVIKSFLGQLDSIWKLRVENLPKEILIEISQMDANEFYEISTKFVILLNNVPNNEKLINLEEDEIIILREEYAKNIVLRIKDTFKNT